MEFYNLLDTACKDIDLQFDEEKYQRFMKYKDLIQEWNKKINLTAIDEDEEIIKKHFIDSMKVCKFDKVTLFGKILDVGTGGGFPGIPLKIINPTSKITLLDSLNKRIKFLNEVIKELNLKDIDAIHGRAEDFARQGEYREQFDGVVSRAVANMTVLSEFCLPYVKVGGYFVALKGPSIDEELDESKKAISILGGKIEKVVDVTVEGSDLRHNLVIIKKIKPTPKKYPRKAGMVTKSPLK